VLIPIRTAVVEVQVAIRDSENVCSLAMDRSQRSGFSLSHANLEQVP